MPEIQGRSAAGVSVTSIGQASPTTASASPAQRSLRSACHVPRPPGASHSQATAIPGTTNSATAILVSKPSPISAAHQTSQRVRPSWNPRTAHHIAATQQRISSSSGLL